MGYGIYEYLSLGYGPEEIEALEGYNWDTRKTIMKDLETDKALDLLKAGKAAARSARKMEKTDRSVAKTKHQEAIKLYTEAYQLADKMKNQVNKMAEPENLGQRILSHFTPLWIFKFPSSEVTDVSPNFMVMSDGSVGGGVTVTHTTYTDSMSRGTKSGVKRSFQERMNLFMKRLSEEISHEKNAVKRCS